jgi:hypothetical protein
MGVEEAELALNAFLSVLKWYHCESGLIAKVPSIYTTADRASPELARPRKTSLAYQSLAETFQKLER